MTPEAQTPQEGTVDSGALAEVIRERARAVAKFRSDASVWSFEYELDSLLAYIKQLEQDKLVIEIDLATEAEFYKARMEQLEGERDALQEWTDRVSAESVRAATAAEKAERALGEARKQVDYGLSLVLSWIDRKYGTIPDDPPSLRVLIEDALEAERALGEMREALVTICAIGETRDVEIARAVLEASDES